MRMDYSMSHKFTATLSIVVVILSLITGSSGLCTYPGVPDITYTTVATDLTKYTAGFKTGEPVVFACEVKDGRFGTTRQTCNSDGTWTDPIRQCNDALKVERGSIAGICMASCNTVMVIIALICGRKYRKNKGEDEEKPEEQKYEKKERKDEKPPKKEEKGGKKDKK